MGKIIINQTDEKQTVILTNDAEGITGVYFGEDGVEKPVGGIEYKRYKVKANTTPASGHFTVPVLGTSENYGQLHRDYPLCALSFYSNSPGMRVTQRSAGGGLLGEQALTNTEGEIDGAALDCELNIYFDAQYKEYIDRVLEEVE